MLVTKCKNGSLLLLNTGCKTVADLDKAMPKNMKKMIADKHL